MKYNILEVFLLNIIFLVRRIQKEFQKKLRKKYIFFFINICLFILNINNKNSAHLN